MPRRLFGGAIEKGLGWFATPTDPLDSEQSYASHCVHCRNFDAIRPKPIFDAQIGRDIVAR